MNTFVLKRGDTSPGLEYEVGAYSVGANLFTGAVVRFKMKSTSGITKVDALAVIQDVDGVLRYGWQTGNTDTAGVFLGEFEVTYSDGNIETFPSDGWITVTINPDI